MTKNEIERTTKEFGGGWAYSHVQRLFKLIDVIAEDIEYDKDIIWYAVYLHDWGAFPRYSQKGVDHAKRSKKIAEEILAQSSIPAISREKILEAIENHDYRNTNTVKSIEAILLREADYIDFLGVIGIVRAFAEGPNDLSICYKRAQIRRDYVRDKLVLEKSKIIAEKRIMHMDTFLNKLLEDSLGYL